ncbi:hypothetical protein HK100_004133 [Physocladia obscura]|uniref:Uncharacterized protein n=1 Tax=Physocladia obscura TaxID=109957 RepID=A0AAD5STH4_9FUNG|nr:hypothetical protein HK100_004133 [Physocladia obscura]
MDAYKRNLQQKEKKKMSPPLALACVGACNAGWVACYAAGGLIAGTVSGGIGVPALALACNTAQGACMAACPALIAVPDPGWACTIM